MSGFSSKALSHNPKTSWTQGNWRHWIILLYILGWVRQKKSYNTTSRFKCGEQQDQHYKVANYFNKDLKYFFTTLLFTHLGIIIYSYITHTCPVWWAALAPREPLEYLLGVTVFQVTNKVTCSSMLWPGWNKVLLLHRSFEDAFETPE